MEFDHSDCVKEMTKTDVEKSLPPVVEQNGASCRIPQTDSPSSHCLALFSAAYAWSCWALRWSWRGSSARRGPPCWSRSRSGSPAGPPSQLLGPHCRILDFLWIFSFSLRIHLNKGSLVVRKVQFFWTLFKRGRGGQTHVQKLCCKFGVFWRSFNNMKFTTWNSPHDVQISLIKP